MGPKKPNLTIAWAGPYQIDWVYTNGSVKLVDLAGLALPGYYNASKIKHYEYVQDQVSTPDKSTTDEEVNLHHDMFDEPTVGSVELIDDYDKLWAEVLDETNQSVSGESMMTAQPGWDSEQEERDTLVMDKYHERRIYRQRTFCKVPACTILRDEMPGTTHNCTVPGNMEGSEAGIQREEGSHMPAEGKTGTSSALSFPSLSKLSIPTSPVSQSLPKHQPSFLKAFKPLPALYNLLFEDSNSQAMETIGEHTRGSSHTEHGGSAGSINLNWAPVPTD